MWTIFSIFLLPSSTTALPQSSQQSPIYDPSSSQRPAAANLATPDPAERQRARLVCLASLLFPLGPFASTSVSLHLTCREQRVLCKFSINELTTSFQYVSNSEGVLLHCNTENTHRANYSSVIWILFTLAHSPHYRTPFLRLSLSLNKISSRYREKSPQDIAHFVFQYYLVYD